MAIVGMIENGKLIDTSATANTESSKATNSSDSMDKEAFLSLLVAQMQYQDPLEPTSNTEYISQFATFSQLEATQNLQSTVTQQFANDLVGKSVIMKVTSNITGDTTHKIGKVDYVTYEGNEIYLYINGKPYSIEDLDTVVTEDYLDQVMNEVEGNGNTNKEEVGDAGNTNKEETEDTENINNEEDAAEDPKETESE